MTRRHRCLSAAYPAGRLLAVKRLAPGLSLSRLSGGEGVPAARRDRRRFLSAAYPAGRMLLNRVRAGHESLSRLSGGEVRFHWIDPSRFILSAAYPAGRASRQAIHETVDLSAAYPAGRWWRVPVTVYFRLSAAYPAGRAGAAMPASHPLSLSRLSGGEDELRPVARRIRSVSQPPIRRGGDSRIGTLDTISLSAAYPAGRAASIMRTGTRDSLSRLSGGEGRRWPPRPRLVSQPPIRRGGSPSDTSTSADVLSAAYPAGRHLERGLDHGQVSQPPIRRGGSRHDCLRQSQDVSQPPIRRGGAVKAPDVHVLPLSAAYPAGRICQTEWTARRNSLSRLSGGEVGMPSPAAPMRFSQPPIRRGGHRRDALADLPHSLSRLSGGEGSRMRPMPPALISQPPIRRGGVSTR